MEIAYTLNVKQVLLIVSKEEGLLKNSIKEKRKKLQLSQEELANACFVSRQTINAIENDKYDPSLELAFRLAECLKMRVDELFIFSKGEKK